MYSQGIWKIKIMKKGDKIYVGNSFYVYRGEDDFCGGIATVEYVGKENTWDYVVLKERPEVRYGLHGLLEDQKEWKKQFGKKKAHKCPDTRPEFNNSEEDWV